MITVSAPVIPKLCWDKGHLNDPRKMYKCTKALVHKHFLCSMTPEIICDPD